MFSRVDNGECMTNEDKDRFWAKVAKPTNTYSDGCWEWRGRLSRQGYGYFDLDGKAVRAHRIAVQIVTGAPLLRQATLDHLCRNRACVRPTHLEVVTSVSVTRCK